MIGCTPQMLLDWVKRDEVDHGERDGASTAERERIKALECEVKELRRTNEILKLASAFFAQAELDRRFKSWAFIDQHRDTFRVEPICKVLRIAPSCYRRHAAQLRDQSKRCVRAKSVVVGSCE
ncbi:hypothetical protein BamMEX5DRAFT_4773 [Burkholderia ambifaria MEX-5]|uniref:Transposase IS3/IS911 family protein n=1 Tax=Burkholderia ambifaria MEX-5 TaxID=396597 RepID=B1TAF7_9BURK|nr:hypothetical protein BamMEX5DRAFT_4773 [Burkholderia ambifaria MEX-5]